MYGYLLEATVALLDAYYHFIFMSPCHVKLADGIPPPPFYIYTHRYWACTSQTDALIGTVLDALANNGFESNTVVLLWGDHGWVNAPHSRHQSSITILCANQPLPLPSAQHGCPSEMAFPVLASTVLLCCRALTCAGDIVFQQVALGRTQPVGKVHKLRARCKDTAHGFTCGPKHCSTDRCIG